MNDLISRLSELRCQYNCFDENERDAYHTLSEAIKAISAQPEYCLDEWCTECKEYDHERHCCPRFNHVIRATLQEVQEEQKQKKGKWIYYPKASGSISSTAVHLYPVCSECGCEHPIANYCPNCGAPMEVEE